MKSKKRRLSWDRLHNFIYKNFKLSLSYLKEIKNYFWFMLVLFFGFGLIGYFFPVFFEEQILNIIQKIIEQTKDLDTWGLINFILMNNLQSTLLAMLLGIFFGIIPFLVIVINGYVLGFVANNVVNSGGLLVLWRLLPHGIFELPAVFISVALGLKLGLFLFTSRKKNWKEFKKWMIDAIRVFILIVIPLLTLAAIIEGWLIGVFG